MKSYSTTAIILLIQMNSLAQTDTNYEKCEALFNDYKPYTTYIPSEKLGTSFKIKSGLDLRDFIKCTVQLSNNGHIEAKQFLTKYFSSLLNHIYPKRRKDVVNTFKIWILTRDSLKKWKDEEALRLCIKMLKMNLSTCDYVKIQKKRGVEFKTTQYGNSSHGLFNSVILNIVDSTSSDILKKIEFNLLFESNDRHDCNKKLGRQLARAVSKEFRKGRIKLKEE